MILISVALLQIGFILYAERLSYSAATDDIYNKPIQDGGEAKAPLWLNQLSGTN